MADEQRERIDDQFTADNIGASLLHELAGGIYRTEDVVREYVQNAVDAHREWEAENGEKLAEPIHIEIRNDKLTIFDYGVGMDLKKVKEAKSIAVSSKPAIGTDQDISLTGYKGVGIWAGLSFFERMVVTTTAAGSDLVFELKIDLKTIVSSIRRTPGVGIGKVINPNYQIFKIRGAATAEEHYTNITLENPVNEELEGKFLDIDWVKQAVRSTCPCEFDPKLPTPLHKGIMNFYAALPKEWAPIRIHVNAQPVYKTYPSQVQNFREDKLIINNEEVARCWYVVSPVGTFSTDKASDDELYGFRVILSGFAIGGKNLYGERELPGYATLKAHEYLDWHAGEIHVTSRGLRPDLSRHEFEESPDKRPFVEVLRQFYADRVKHNRTRRDIEICGQRLDMIAKQLDKMSTNGVRPDQIKVLDVIGEDLKKYKTTARKDATLKSTHARLIKLLEAVVAQIPGDARPENSTEEIDTSTETLVSRSPKNSARTPQLPQTENSGTSQPDYGGGVPNSKADTYEAVTNSSTSAHATHEFKGATSDQTEQLHDDSEENRFKTDYRNNADTAPLQTEELQAASATDTFSLEQIAQVLYDTLYEITSGDVKTVEYTVRVFTERLSQAR